MRRVTAGALALALSFTSLAHAQNVTPLPPVTVPLPPEPRPEAPATRDPSGSSSVVDARAHAGEVRDAAELAATAPGVILQDSGGVGQSKALLVRGASSSGVLVLLDGVPVNGAGGIADVSLVPVTALESVEVLRGGAGARYGSGGLGGVVNLVTRPLADVAGAGEADVVAGSFGTVRAGLSGQTRLAGGSELLLVHAERTTGDFPFVLDDRPEDPRSVPLRAVRTNNDATSGGGLLKDRRPLGAWTAATLLEGVAVERGIAGTVYDLTPTERQDVQRGSLSTRFSRSFDSGLNLAVRAWGRAERSAFQGGRAPTVQTLLSNGASVDAGGVVAGWHALSGTAELGYDGLVQTPTARWLRGSLMAMDEMLLADGTVTVAPSMRVDRTGPFTTLSPKLGASLALPHGWTVRANAGVASRAPSFLELYVRQGSLASNDQLVPEQALTVDAQVVHSTAWSSITAGGFASDYSNLIVYEFIPPFLSRPLNIGHAQVAGAELEARLSPRPWLALQAAYTFLATRTLSDDPRIDGKALPNRPAHRGTAALELGPSLLHGRVELDAQSALFTNSNQTLQLPGRAYVNVALASTLGSNPQVVLTAELKNAFDVQAQDLDGYPLPGRALYVGARIALDAPRSSQSELKARP